MNTKQLAPELILLHGNFHTQDPNQPEVTAVSIGGGHILEVGSDAYIKSFMGTNTKTINLGGRLGLPGMIDSHFHFYDWALGRQQLQLADVTSFKECMERVAYAARKAGPGKWIVGQGWNESEWPENRMPNRYDLDTAAPFNPVALWRCDLHLAAVNSQALQLAGIDKNTPNPPQGVIAKDSSGEPTGILRELAPNLVRAAIKNPDDEELLEAMRDGITFLHTLGVTGLHDTRLMGGLEGATALRGWQRLHEMGDLDLRCWAGIPGERLEEAAGLGLRTGLGNDRLRIGYLKYFADGGMGARTAWMLEPYLDAECGMPLFPMNQFAEAIKKADRAGLAVMIHAIGDRANREVVSVFEELKKSRLRDKNGPYAPPAISHRIEHVQMIRPEDLKRLARLGIPACVQPHNMILDIGMINESVGDKGKWTYAYRDMLDAGIPLILSSDAPVCDASPLAGIHAAVTRQRRDGTPEGGWYPHQRISVDEAVRGYTVTPAMAYGQDHTLGSITPGKYADLIILEKNIYTIDPMEIADTKVDMTIFDGRIVYQRSDA
jgi:predicted amidohydrolase YtcJ